jgi:glyoxylase-like metal-dependent hydrolase (beta-lactamase superfamily II)
MRVLLVALLAVVATSGCATVSRSGPPPGGLVHTFQQRSVGLRANVFWFETPAGAVVVDTPLTITDAKSLRGTTGRPYRIYVTSAKPERFGGLAILRAPDVPAYTTPAVATEIQNYGGRRLTPYRKTEGDDVASRVEPPSPAVEERTHDMVGEVEVELLPLGPAESEASLALFLPKTGELITGDVVAGGQHLDLTWGRSVVWQDRINELKALEPKLVYPGHGSPGGPELLDQTLAYLKFFHDVVATRVKSGAPARISSSDLNAIKQQMMAQFPKYGRSDLLDKSIPGEYAVQLAALPPAPAAPHAATAGAPGAPR